MDAKLKLSILAVLAITRRKHRIFYVKKCSNTPLHLPAAKGSTRIRDRWGKGVVNGREYKIEGLTSERAECPEFQ